MDVIWTVFSFPTLPQTARQGWATPQNGDCLGDRIKISDRVADPFARFWRRVGDEKLICAGFHLRENSHALALARRPV
jgi:hypothetical protein